MQGHECFCVSGEGRRSLWVMGCGLLAQPAWPLKDSLCWQCQLTPETVHSALVAQPCCYPIVPEEVRLAGKPLLSACRWGGCLCWSLC